MPLSCYKDHFRIYTIRNIVIARVWYSVEILHCSCETVCYRKTTPRSVF